MTASATADEYLQTTQQQNIGETGRQIPLLNTSAFGRSYSIFFGDIDNLPLKNEPSIRIETYFDENFFAVPKLAEADLITEIEAMWRSFSSSPGNILFVELGHQPTRICRI
ncbi:MAG: hypothetical protein ACR2PH_14965, partial [Desulfobulbia bacterium]